MKKFIVWMEMTFKRLFHRKGFLALLLALPLIGAYTRYWEANHTTGVEVGLLQSQEPLAQKTISKLLKNEGLFRFVTFTDKAELVRSIETRKIEAGVIFSKDLTARLDSGNPDGSIELLQSPSSVTQGMVAEVVFSELLQDYSPRIIARIVKGAGIFQGKEADVTQRIIDNYNVRAKKGGSFQFKYQELSGQKAAKKGLDLFPLRGLLAIFIMLTAWIMVLSWYKDQEGKIFNAFPGSKRPWAGLTGVLLPVLLMTLAGYLLLIVSGKGGNPILEFLQLLFYAGSITTFLYGAKIFFKNPIAYGALMPVALLGSLVASPTILDLSSLIPNINLLGKFFFPSYYLAMSQQGALWAVLGLLALLALGLFLTSRERA